MSELKVRILVDETLGIGYALGREKDPKSAVRFGAWFAARSAEFNVVSAFDHYTEIGGFDRV